MPPAPEYLATIPPGLRAATAQLQDLVFSSPSNVTVDRDAFTFAATIHGVAPLLGVHVQRGELSVSPELDLWLTEQAKRNRERLQRMRDELLTTLDAFDRAGIDIIPLKGTAMILGDLDDIAWRPMADLDVLVRHDDQQRVDLAFAHAGYCLHSQSWKHSVYGPCAEGERVLHFDGEHPDNPRDLESHEAVIEMFRGFRWDITPWIVNNLRGQNGASVPSGGAMSLHLSLHLSMSILESTTRMVQVVDFGRIIKIAGTSAILQAVQKSGIEHHARFVYPAVTLTARWTENAALATLESELRPHVPAAMPAWLANLDFHDISWAGREERGLLNRLGIWGRTPTEHARMVAATIAPTPDQLASAGYPGSGPLAVLRWYPAHYRHLLGRLTN